MNYRDEFINDKKCNCNCNNNRKNVHCSDNNKICEDIEMLLLIMAPVGMFQMIKNSFYHDIGILLQRMGR